MINLKRHRPGGHSEIEIQALSKIRIQLSRLLIDTQESFTFETLILPKNKLDELALTIVEFAEDLINKMGVWESLEKYNIKYFSTPLPFSLPLGQRVPKRIINENRIHYLLWNKYSEFDPSLIIAPTHKDLNLITKNIYNFFENRNNIVFPPDSSIKVFLDQPNNYGWDIKKKLLWLGQHSYLFRHCYENYIDDNGGIEEIPLIDDFVCQHETRWSGLRVPDILASILNITKNQRRELQSWYERHLSYFEIESIKGPIVLANNIISNKTYSIRVGENSNMFKVGNIYLGSLVPWNNEWYWSGQQTHLGKTPQNVIQKMKEDLIQKSPQIVYRYYKSILKKAKQRIKAHYQNFVKFHGDDLAVFSDGYSMAAAFQKKHRLEYEAQPKDIVNEIMKKHNLKNPWPNFGYSSELLESDNGIGVFFNPEEGLEIMKEFHYVLNGFKKKGVNLTEKEYNAIRGFIESEAISINFVKKIVDKYGSESIAETFLIRTDDDIDFLTYILRQYKGHFFRNRYPYISFK